MSFRNESDLFYCHLQVRKQISDIVWLLLPIWFLRSHGVHVTLLLSTEYLWAPGKCVDHINTKCIILFDSYWQLMSFSIYSSNLAIDETVKTDGSHLHYINLRRKTFTYVIALKTSSLTCITMVHRKWTRFVVMLMIIAGCAPKSIHYYFRYIPVFPDFHMNMRRDKYPNHQGSLRQSEGKQYTSIYLAHSYRCASQLTARMQLYRLPPFCLIISSLSLVT